MNAYYNKIIFYIIDILHGIWSLKQCLNLAFADIFEKSLCRFLFPSITLQTAGSIHDRY